MARASIYFPKSRTAAEWREMAQECHRRSAESFDRCDTDGFLSQGAADAMALLYRLCAEIAGNGGKATFVRLSDLNGNLLDAKECKTRFGYSWRIVNADGSVSWFSESNAKNGERRRKFAASKGYMLVNIETEAVVFPAGWSGGYAAPARDAEVAVIGEIEYPND